MTSKTASRPRHVAGQVNQLGPADAVIHNAGAGSGPDVLAVNVVAPYLLTTLITRPRRLIYLSSSMHRGGRPRLDGANWTAERSTGSHSDSKLFVTLLAFAVARCWPDVSSNAVDPGWVPTRMGGHGAPDDLTLGHLTQEWLARSDDPDALTTGGYWHHQRRLKPPPPPLTHGSTTNRSTNLRTTPASGSPEGQRSERRLATVQVRPLIG